jgi:hypothetical protein
MYTITAGKDGVVFGCMDCSRFVRVNDYKNKLGNPRTLAAAAMSGHLSSHRMTRLLLPTRQQMIPSHT